MSLASSQAARVPWVEGGTLSGVLSVPKIQHWGKGLVRVVQAAGNAELPCVRRKHRELAEASEPGAEMEGVEHRERGRVGLCQSD